MTFLEITLSFAVLAFIFSTTWFMLDSIWSRQVIETLDQDCERLTKDRMKLRRKLDAIWQALNEEEEDE